MNFVEMIEKELSHEKMSKEDTHAAAHRFVKYLAESGMTYSQAMVCLDNLDKLADQAYEDLAHNAAYELSDTGASIQFKLKEY